MTSYADYEVFTLQNAAQTNPIDVTNVTYAIPVSSKSTSVTTTQGNDFLASVSLSDAPNSLSAFGASETAVITADQDPSGGIGPMNSAWKATGSSAGSETMTTTWNSAKHINEAVVAVKAYSGPVPLPTATTTIYAYAQTGFANPDGVTSIGNGVSTTTYVLRHQRQPHPSRRLELHVGLSQSHARLGLQ